MKVRLLLFALVVAVVGLGACGGGDDEKSSEKAITKFTVNGVDYQINESAKTINYIYPKGPTAGTWPTEPTWPQTPVIVVSAKANYTPTSSQTFIPGPVSYVVTAEDGTTVTYTVKAERGTY